MNCGDGRTDGRWQKSASGGDRAGEGGVQGQTGKTRLDGCLVYCKADQNYERPFYANSKKAHSWLHEVEVL